MELNFITKENVQKVKNITKTKGKNAKIELLKEYIVDKSFVELIQMTYDPYKPYKIKKISSKHYGIKLDSIPNSIKEFLLYMSNKPSANDQDIATAGYIIMFLDDMDLALLFKRVLTKDFKMGCNVRSLNEAGYNIPTFDLQLAQPQSHLDKFYKENENGFIVQTKFDGNRAICKIDKDGVPKFYSRGGHTIESCDFLLYQISSMKLPPNSILDGEILHKSLNLQQLQSIVSKKDSTHNRGQELTYQVFDCLRWNNVNYMDIKLSDRMLLIKNELCDNNYIVAAPYDMWEPSMGDHVGYVQAAFQKVLDEGHEGLILKSPTSVYEGKRSRNWVKIKERDNLDLEVLQLIEGEGRFENMMGAVVCHINGHNFHVGTGWKESERKYFWKHPNNLLGKIIEIGYWKFSPDGVPLHPAKVRIREDK